ncbi:hypothetical protein D7X98_01190 [bacterium 1XD8-76]|nr:hypothetical protein D7X98_01190 [bacterium 1XD8-76]
MRRKLVKIWMPLFMTAILLAGCQKAPETANDDEILRAKGSSDDAVEAILNEEEGIDADGAKEKENSKSGEAVSAVLGTDGNRMRIEAEIPAVPEELSTLAMQMDSRLDGKALRDFLDPQGEVKDYTEQLLAEEEAERQRVAEIDEKLGEGSSIVEIPGVGDGSCLALTDGNRKAVLWGKTGGSYMDVSLKEKCLAAAKDAAQELDVKEENEGDASFSLQDAKALLMQKLSVLGVEDIYLSEAYFYETDGLIFYELQFAPVVDGIPIACCFGYQEASRVYPNGYAWVSAEGVAEISLWNCLMEQVSAAEKERILSFDKVQKLLETYLKDGSLQCVEDVPFSTAELVYGVELKDGKLELSPMWSVHMDLGEYVEYAGQTGSSDPVWNIYMDAVTGELVEVQ